MSENFENANKIEQALNLYDLNIDDEKVAKTVKKLLDDHLEENNTK